MINFSRGFPRRWPFFTFVLIFAAGCAQEVPIMARLPPPPSEAVAIPLKVGLYLDPAFREYVYVERNYRLPLGGSLSGALKTYLTVLFAQVEDVPEPTWRTLREGSYQAVVRPEIRATYYRPFFRRRTMPMQPPGRMFIVTHWTLSDPEGRPIWSQETTGEAEGDPRSPFRLSRAVEEAIFDLLSKVGEAILGAPEIERYARSVQASGLR